MGGLSCVIFTPVKCCKYFSQINILIMFFFGGNNSEQFDAKKVQCLKKEETVS